MARKTASRRPRYVTAPDGNTRHEARAVVKTAKGQAVRTMPAEERRIVASAREMIARDRRDKTARQRTKTQKASRRANRRR